MANTDKPAGFHPVMLQGGGHSPEINIWPQAGAEIVYIGDMMELTSGVVDVADADDNKIHIGPALNYTAILANADVYIADDPSTIFWCQADDGGTALASTDRGAQRDLLATTGDTTTFMSKQEVDASETTYNTFQILRLHQGRDVANAWGDDVDIQVRIVEHALAPLIA